MSTIKHVAARAGVSFTTVSHVLNGTRRVSDSARARVEEAVQALGYSPSAVARALKTSETHILGVVVPNITNPFFAELTRGIEDACERAGYSVFLCNGDDDPARQGRALRTLMQRRVDGVVLATPTGEPGDVKRFLGSTPVKTVVVDRPVPGLDADLVRIDHEAGARLAVQHLLEFGHRRIACISGPMQFAVSKARVEGWRKALLKAGVKPSPSWLLESEFDAAGGYERARQLLETGDVTAIFASNDLIAIGALRAAAELGRPVPGTLSIVGFDAIDLGAFSYPALTTVGYPIREIGEMATRVLIDRIAGKGPSKRESVVQPRLVVRESTAPVEHA